MKAKLLSCVAGLALAVAAPAKALVIAPPAVPIKLAQADAVVVGKVSKLEEKQVPADRFKGDTAQLKVAVLQVGETLLGKKEKEIKVGFIPPMPAGPARPIRPGGFRGPQLAAGQEACLYLTRHPTRKDLHILSAYYAVVNKTDANFARETEEVRKYAKLLADPKKGLTAKDAEERYTTAAMLLTRYGTPRPGNTGRTHDVGSEQSRLILQALTAIDWKMPPGGPRNYSMAPRAVFGRLGLTPQDGWKPTNLATFETDAQAWLKANAGKYRVKSYVPVKKDEDPEP